MIRAVETYSRISTRYGDPVSGSRFGRHLGTDYACPSGTAVRATVSGRVSSVTFGASGGLAIEMYGDDGRTWRFLHLSQNDVKANQRVAEGQLIARSGASGQVTGPHLHVDVRKGGTNWYDSFANYYDPERLLKEAEPRYVYLKKNIPKWAFYRPGTVLPVRREDRAGELAPEKWGGLTYPFIRWVAANTAEVKSPSLGVIWIYIDDDAELRY